MKLITETIEEVKYVTEGKGAEKSLYIEGPFLVGNTKNKNGQISSKIMDKPTNIGPQINFT